jgi:nucleoside-diphosphate-sugar epimerase
MGVEGLKCVVTGGSGLVGQRLVEMLVERGAARVVSFDIVGKPQYASDDDRIVYLQGDLGEYSDVEKAVDGADCVWHIGALVGPFHPFKAFRRVNYEGTLNVIKACQTKGVCGCPPINVPQSFTPFRTRQVGTRL